MRIAIVEDDEVCADQLLTHIHRYEKENTVSFEAETYTNGMEFLYKFHADFDVVLLDIEMPLIDGIETAKRIREIDEEILIIFVTRMAQYAVKAFDVQALDYILKPVNYYAFSMKMNRVVRILEGRRKDRYIIVQNNEGASRVAVASILYIEIFGHRLAYHTTDGTVTSAGSKTISTLSAELQPEGLIRCNQSYLVNLSFVQGLRKDMIVLKDGTSIPVSRNYKKSFIQQLMSYWSR